jgi:hypothetical protein
MTRHSILEYAAALRPRYLHASRSEKGVILSRFLNTGTELPSNGSTESALPPRSPRPPKRTFSC